MSSRQQRVGLIFLCMLLFVQVICFFLNAVDNFFATLSLTFMGHKGAALVRPIAQVENIALVGRTLTCFYVICCLLFFFLLIGLASRRPIFFRLLLVLDAISLLLGLYGYYFWMAGRATLTPMEHMITLIEPLLSSGGLVLLIAVPAIRNLWWPRKE